ncbi:hypothetical protein PFISCL1PPCAC_16643, partial [Pristionchus fissidentatus]
ICGLQWYIMHSLEGLEEEADENEEEEGIGSPNVKRELPWMLCANDGRHTSIEWSCEGVVDIDMRDIKTGTLIDRKRCPFKFSNSCSSAHLPLFEYDHNRFKDPVFITTIRISKASGLRVPMRPDFSTPSESYDVTFHMKDERKVYGSSKALSIMCEEFNEMLCDGTREVQLGDIKSEDLVVLLHYLNIKKAYTDNC